MMGIRLQLSCPAPEEWWMDSGLERPCQSCWENGCLAFLRPLPVQAVGAPVIWRCDICEARTTDDA